MHLVKASLIIFVLYFQTASIAQESYLVDDLKSEEGSVIVETPVDYTQSYKKRRTPHGFILGLHSETYYPLDYQSQFATGYVEDIIGDSSITLNGLELGYKYNISIGSLSGVFSYSVGSAGGNGTLDVTKQAFEAIAAVDGILEEPWVVPYFQFGMHSFNISEDNGAESRSAATSYSFNYKYGLLFQIDWLENLFDPDAKAERLRSSGLENTFIDVYFSNYMASSGAQDPEILGVEGEPNIASAGEMGLGLKLEF